METGGLPTAESPWDTVTGVALPSRCRCRPVLWAVSLPDCFLLKLPPRCSITSDVAFARERLKELLSGSRAYWICQAAGWSAFLVARQAVALAASAGFADSLAYHAITAASGLLITHLLRAWIRLASWQTLAGSRLAPRVFLLILVGAVLWTFTVRPFSPPASSETAEALSAGWLVTVLAVNQAIILGVWLGLYLGYQAFRQSQNTALEKLRLERAVSEAELRALKAQINPHFLFNCLNSVRALIDEDPARAREAITQLAQLLRTSLQSGARETATLASEIQAVQSYLALEKLRHEDRLRFSMDVTQEASAAQVPTMLLQNLVENAVKYGVGVEPTGSDIHLHASADPDGVVIRVTNTGRILSGASVGSTGIGLRNSEERLRLLFGRSATLRLHESTPGLVTAEVRIPHRNA